MADPGGARRFLLVEDVAEILNTTRRHVYELLKAEQLKGMQMGGRNLWRIASTDLDDYIARCYAETADRLRDRAETPSD